MRRPQQRRCSTADPDLVMRLAAQGHVGRSYCVGGHGERSNKQVVEAICALLDQRLPSGAPHARLITRVTDRPGQDRRYAIDPTRISKEQGGYSGGRLGVLASNAS